MYRLSYKEVQKAQTFKNSFHIAQHCPPSSLPLHLEKWAQILPPDENWLENPGLQRCQ